MNHCFVWLASAAVLGFALGHWRGTRWGIRHAEQSQRIADFWYAEFERWLVLREKRPANIKKGHTA